MLSHQDSGSPVTAENLGHNSRIWKGIWSCFSLAGSQQRADEHVSPAGVAPRAESLISRHRHHMGGGGRRATVSEDAETGRPRGTGHSRERSAGTDRGRTP